MCVLHADDKLANAVCVSHRHGYQHRVGVKLADRITQQNVDTDYNLDAITDGVVDDHFEPASEWLADEVVFSSTDELAVPHADRVAHPVWHAESNADGDCQ